VPEGAEWDAVNRLELPADGSNSALLLRIVAPNGGVVIRPEDLPTIEAFDAQTGAPKECPKLADSGSGNPWAGGRLYAKVKEIFLLIGRKRTKKSWHWTRFDVVEIPFEGNSGVSGYSVGRTQIAPGRNVAITKFKAPTFVNTFPGTGTFEPDAEMRYWSMCILDLEEAQTLACLPDYLAKVDPEGFVTVVYARPGPGVEMIANSYGYNFLPDLREPTFENGRKMMMFVYRQILPSEEFAMTKLHQGDYVPQRKVCPRFFFLAGVCGI